MRIFLSLVLSCWLAGTAIALERPALIVVVGAPGTPEYGTQFRQWAERWSAAAKTGQAECTVIGLEPENGKLDRDLLQEQLAKQQTASSQGLWLVLIGHGTFDGKTARFTLRGLDFTPQELGKWLAPIERPVAVINCTSSSAPFVAELSGKNRVVISATKSGHEFNFARLGDFLSQAITDPAADLDKDDQVSLLEAFLVGAAKTREFYKSSSRLATEAALLDDNGDRLGTPAEWFIGLRPTKGAKDGVALDGIRAAQFVLVRSGREEKLADEVRTQRDKLELDLAALRQRKAATEEAAYFAELEKLLVELAKLYDAAEKPAEDKPANDKPPENKPAGGL